MKGSSMALYSSGLDRSVYILIMVLTVFIVYGTRNVFFSRSKTRALPVIVGYVLAYVIKDNKVLLIYRTNTGFADNKYGLIGGKIEENESARQAVIRELNEEIGITVKPEDARLVHVMSFQGQTRPCMSLIFAIKSWQGEPYNKEIDKHGHIAWFSLDNLPETIIPRHKHILEYIKNNQLYAEEGFKQ